MVNRSLIWVYIAGAFLIYGASISYPFVYDDYAKIVDNRAITNLSNLTQNFFDPAIQSDNPRLNRHTFRPLFVFLTGLEFRAFNGHATGFRFINILFHGINAFLVMWLAVRLMGLSAIPASVAGFAFLVHPCHVESVVWVIEQSNVLCTASILGALISWIHYLRTRQTYSVLVTWFLFIAALFVRENGFIFPFAALLVAFYFYTIGKIEQVPKRSIYLLFVVALLVFLLRRAAVQQLAQSELAPFTSQLSLIGSSFVYALRMILVPFPITVNHLYIGWTTWMTVVVMAASLGMWMVRRQSVFFMLMALLLICWFPTAHIIPIAAFFAERFLYMPLIAWSLLQAWIWSMNEQHRRGRIIISALVALNIFYVTTTWRAIPVWSSDVSLWNHAAIYTPNNWRVWFNLASSEKLEHPNYANDVIVLKRIKSDLVTALRCSIPSVYAIDVFLQLAKVNAMLGETQEAQQNAGRAAQLQAEVNRIPAP